MYACLGKQDYFLAILTWVYICFNFLFGSQEASHLQIRIFLCDVEWHPSLNRSPATYQQKKQDQNVLNADCN